MYIHEAWKGFCVALAVSLEQRMLASSDSLVKNIDSGAGGMTYIHGIHILTYMAYIYIHGMHAHTHKKIKS